MRRSEIFDNFVKIAQDKGLIAKSSPEENKADLEKTHRADSLSIEDIAHLYGVKPDAPADAKYEHNIMERAHPDPVVIAPSYDKINGLIENNNERQNILLNIVNKTNDGQLLQRKLAKRNLLLSLVRVGNEMDNRGHDELRSLADVCLRQSSAPQIRKEAQLQVIIPVIAAIVGGLYAKQHLRFHSDGFTADYQKAISELDDLLNSNNNFGIVGYQYRPEFLQVVNEIKNQLAELNTAVQAILPELDKLEKPKDGPDLVRMAKEPKAHEAIQALQNFQTTVHKIYPFLLQVVNNFQNEGYKQRQIVDKGIATKVLDSTEILHGGKGLIADDFDDAAHALETIFYDVNNIAKSLQGADGEADAAAKQLTAANASMPGGGQAGETEANPNAPAYTPPTLPTAGELGESTTKSPVQEAQTRSLEQELEENPDLIGLT